MQAGVERDTKPVERPEPYTLNVDPERLQY